MREKIAIGFDIDGTLIKTPEYHILAYGKVIEEMFGIKLSVKDIFRHLGKTSEGIIKDILKEYNVDYEEEDIKNCVEKIDKLAIKLIFEKGVELYPSVKKVIERLKNSGFLMGVVTGNKKEVAEAKLKAAGLYEFFDKDLIVSSEISHDRSVLVKEFKERAMKKGCSHIFIVGDTSNDILAGKANDVFTIGIPTEFYNKNELEMCSPNCVITDFKYLEKAIVECLGGKNE